jgi:hypothetical protein
MRTTNGLLTRLAMAVAVLTLALVLINAGLVMANQSSQAQAAARQQAINQGTELIRANQVLVQTLVTVAASTKDDALSALLGRYNIPLPGAAAAVPEKK